MGSDPYSSYKETQVETASQEKILLMLYEGCIKFTRQAKQALHEEDYKTSHDKLIQAQDIITELMSTLDMDVGGEIAEELFRLYDFCLHNMIQANVDKDPSRLDDVLPVLEDLNEAWDEVINEQGMTLEKARKEVGQTQQDISGDSGGPSETTSPSPGTNDESNTDSRDPSQTPQPPDDDSLEGNVTYGDI
ncbi:MAG: flagellar export chaperone FliS [bacterium]